MARANKSGIKRKVNISAAVGLTVANSLLLRAGLRRPRDGWRRGAGLLLRGEESTFYLTAFGLDAGYAPNAGEREIEQHVARRLADFLAAERDSHVRIRNTPAEDLAENHSGPCHTLAFDPWVDGPGRFLCPDRWLPSEISAGSNDKRDYSPLLNIVCRVSPRGVVDIWARANHVGIDGVPLQELLTRLQEAWGVKEPPVFCSSQEFAPHSRPRDCGSNEIAEIHDFIDFSPLLAWRSAQNKRLAAPMTFSAALIWALARHRQFAGLYIGSTVEIPAVSPFGRGVGVVTLRPADYFSRSDGLADYVRDFNRELDLTRQRKSRGCKTLDAAAHVPPTLARLLLGSAIEQGGSAFGSLGLTVVRDAQVFGAPMGDPSHADGFIAVGSATLDAGNGKRVGSVTIKGRAEKIAGYPKFIHEAVQMKE